VNVARYEKGAIMNEGCRQSGLEILRLRRELQQAEEKVHAGIAQPTWPGSQAQSVPPSLAQRDAERIRMRLLMAEVRYQHHGGTVEYLKLFADELAESESNSDGEP
jgi:hypothetical protein